MSDEEPVERVLRIFAALHPECHDGDWVTDRCFGYAEAFVDLAHEAGLQARVVTGLMAVQDVIYAGHAAAQVEGLIYDWTRRQFEPEAAVPTVYTVEQWQQAWPWPSRRQVQ